MAVTHDHAAVQTEVSCFAGGNGFDLGGDKVFFFNAVLILQDLQDLSLRSFLSS